MNTVEDILNDLVELIKLTLDQGLVGIYLYGSLVAGDFDDKLSDIDLLVVTKSEISPQELNKLDAMHKTFNVNHTDWSERVDLAYVSKLSLLSFKTITYSAATVCGGQELAIIQSKPHWLIDWYKVRKQSKVLFGAAQEIVIPPISKEEFKETIRQYTLGWPNETQSKTDPVDLAYVTLAVCRSLYAYKYGENVSKKYGAHWAIGQYPEFEVLIQKALKLSRISNTSDLPSKIEQNEVLNMVNFACTIVR